MKAKRSGPLYDKVVETRETVNRLLDDVAPDLLAALKGVIQHIERGELVVIQPRDSNLFQGTQTFSRINRDATSYMASELKAIISKVDVK